MKKRRKEWEEWFGSARDDLAFARSGLKDEFYSHVCVLAQQAVEKAMKGALLYQQKSYPRTHGLVHLHQLLKVNWLDTHLGAIKTLAEFYVPLRYPDAAGTLPDGLPNKLVASEALRWAEEIVDLIATRCR